MASMYSSKAFKDAKATGDRDQFPDGYEADVVVVRTFDKLDGFYGPRFIAEFVNPETDEQGSYAGSLQGKSLTVTFGRVKSLFASLNGINPTEQDKVDEVVTPKMIEQANAENTYEGTYVHVKVRYNENAQNPAKPFVNYTFSPCLDEKGNVRKLG